MAIRPSETDVAGSKWVATTVPGSAGATASHTSSGLGRQFGATVTMDATDFSQAGRARGSQLIREKL